MGTAQENILNVTLLEPRKKHPTIFLHFDALSAGESLIILNDHDPKPLYYQLLGERGNIFIWEYLEEGPEWWKVRISKRSSGEKDETLGQLAANDLRKAEIFRKYGLDFCCGGKKTVKDACLEKGIDVTKVEQELQQAEKLTFSTLPLPFNEWNLGFLADYIINTHHRFVKKTGPEIRSYAEKVKSVHGERHPELRRVNELVESLICDLEAHMTREELQLFPQIKSLEASGVVSKNPVDRVESLSKIIAAMEKEHEKSAGDLEELKAITNNYRLPEDACASYSLLYQLLKQFEEDLHMHVHLENNILFPKAVEKERRLSNK